MGKIFLLFSFIIMQERSPPVSLIGLGMTEAITTAAKSHNDDEDSKTNCTTRLKKQERDRFLKFHALPTICLSLLRVPTKILIYSFVFVSSDRSSNSDDLLVYIQ